MNEEELQVLELLLRLLPLVPDVVVEDLTRIVLYFAMVRIGEHCVHRDGEEAVEVLDGLDQSDRI